MNEDKVRKLITIPDPLWERISAFRWSNRVGTETQALRLLLEKGLEAVEAERTEGGAAA